VVTPLDEPAATTTAITATSTTTSAAIVQRERSRSRLIRSQYGSHLSRP
jgi:hypothetical protein